MNPPENQPRHELQSAERLFAPRPLSQLREDCMSSAVGNVSRETTTKAMRPVIEAENADNEAGDNNR